MSLAAAAGGGLESARGLALVLGVPALGIFLVSARGGLRSSRACCRRCRCMLPHHTWLLLTTTCVPHCMHAGLAASGPGLSYRGSGGGRLGSRRRQRGSVALLGPAARAAAGSAEPAAAGEWAGGRGRGAPSAQSSACAVDALHQLPIHQLLPPLPPACELCRCACMPPPPQRWHSLSSRTSGAGGSRRGSSARPRALRATPATGREREEGGRARAAYATPCAIL